MMSRTMSGLEGSGTVQVWCILKTEIPAASSVHHHNSARLKYLVPFIMLTESEKLYIAVTVVTCSILIKVIGGMVRKARSLG